MDYLKHFGERSGDYCRFRPDYPEALYQYILKFTLNRDLAWDVGTGNGQAAVKLAQYFKKVIGTDLNQKQLDVAIQKENIEYRAWPAEKTEIPSGSVDLVTVAQALHWFPLDLFYKEVRRVAKPNAVIAAWAYSLIHLTPEIDAIVSTLYAEILGDQYWPKERKYIDNAYQTLPFPFEEIDSSDPKLWIEKKYDLDDFLGYLQTWSGVKEYLKRNQQNPIDLIVQELKQAWGDPKKEYIARWPIHLKLGRV